MPSVHPRLAACALLVLAVACSTSGASSDHDVTLRVVKPPTPTTGPFVVVAVDNHFHDIHYRERNEISQDRPFVVKNEGRNLHNFTVVGTDVSIDIRPGHRFAWSRLGDHLAPGTYRVICTYHADRGMGGHFTVTR